MVMLVKKKIETRRRIGNFLMKIIPYDYYGCELGTSGSLTAIGTCRLD